MYSIRAIPVFFALCACLTLAACGSSGDPGPQLHAVNGKVIKGEEPLPDVTVTFQPVEEGLPTSIGTTDQDGRFKLSTPQGRPGAAAGRYKVLLSKSLERDAAAKAYSGKPKGPPKAKNLPFPKEYRKAETTPKTVTVEAEGENNFTIDVAQ